MAAADRRKQLRETVRALRQYEHMHPEMTGTALPFTSHAECIGYIVAVARNAEADETVIVEAVLADIGLPREALEEAESVLRPLGYTAVARLLQRLAKRAKPRPDASSSDQQHMAERLRRLRKQRLH